MIALSEQVERKITKSYNLSDYEILTDEGYVDVNSLHETITYDVWELKTENYTLLCADNHIVFDINMNEVFVKNLCVGDVIQTESGPEKIISNSELGYQEVMYDFELPEGSNHRYYTSGILSHNTHLAKTLAKEIFGSSDALIRVDMSEYMEKHSVAKMVGSPPGYVGHDEGGQLTEQVKNKPYSVILFDEIEKAHRDVFNILLQVMDEGHLTDSRGKKINFKNTIILMTSNIGARKVADFGEGIGFKAKNRGSGDEAAKAIINKELKNKFAPEFLNRVDDVILFNHLTEENIKTIVRLELEKLNTRLTERNFTVRMHSSVVDYIAKVGYDEKYGARPLKRAIQDNIEDYLSEEILKNNIKEGLIYEFSLSENGEPSVKKKAK